MLFKNHSSFLLGYKAASRQPPAHELSAVVRAKYDLVPGQPLTLARSKAVEDDTIEVLAEGQQTPVDDLDDALVLLGQGSLRSDEFVEGDDQRQGQVVYPSDFGDFKLSADVMVRASCYPGRTATECTVQIDVGEWSKKLDVIGIHVWTDRIAGGKKTEPQPFDRMPLDYAHAYGGPGFVANPIGKGHLDDHKKESADEELYVPPRSERSAVMVSKQLSNVRHAGGAELKNGLPAAFGPVSPNWDARRSKLGNKYDKTWRATRSPYFSEDFDWRYFNAAPPDQQLEGYLTGDEKLRFRNMHRDSTDFSARLPGKRVRLFVLDDRDEVREVPMNLDTLFVDLDNDALYLSWRGLTSAREADLSDVTFGYLVAEELADKPGDAAPYEEKLRAFAADPVGMDEVMPAELKNAAELMDQLDGDDEALNALLEHEDENNPVSAMLANLGALGAPVADAVRGPLDMTLAGLDQGELKKTLASSIKRGRAPAASGDAAVAEQIRSTRALLAQQESVFGSSPELDGAFAQLDEAGGDESPNDLPGPGAKLRGEDLSGQDLSGIDLTGADLSHAVLESTNLQGATLVDAALTGAQLSRTDLSGADLSGADLSEVIGSKATLTGAKLDGAKLDMSQWMESDFSDASLVDVTAEIWGVTESTFSRVTATKMKLVRSNFDKVKLDGADLSE